jgi:hypothetical protein
MLLLNETLKHISLEKQETTECWPSHLLCKASILQMCSKNFKSYSMSIFANKIYSLICKAFYVMFSFIFSLNFTFLLTFLSKLNSPLWFMSDISVVSMFGTKYQTGFYISVQLPCTSKLSRSTHWSSLNSPFFTFHSSQGSISGP